MSAAALANPLLTASTAVLSPDLVSLINQAVQAAVRASQRQPGPAIAGPASCPGASSSSASLGGLASTFSVFFRESRIVTDFCPMIARF